MKEEIKEELNVNELIKVESLPKIFYQLEVIGKKVDEALEGVEDMVCNEDNKKEVKKRKQEITAFKNLMETRRKDIKKQVMAKYDEFNNKYEEEVKSKLENAEEILKAKYTKIELEQIEVKTKKIKDFVNESIIASNLQDIITYEDIDLNITLTATEKSLREKAKEFIDRTAQEIELINLEQYSDEIMIEYKETLNYADSKIKVTNRHKQLEEMQKRQEEIQNKINEEQQVVERVEEIINEELPVPEEVIVEEITAPEEVQEEQQYEMNFKVIGTIKQLKAIKEFLESVGVKYEQQ